MVYNLEQRTKSKDNLLELHFYRKGNKVHRKGVQREKVPD